MQPLKCNLFIISGSQNNLVDNNNNNDNALDLNTLANDINNNCFSPTDCNFNYF
jgi:hypothetical protein